MKLNDRKINLNGINIVRNTFLPPNTMIISDDVFEKLEQELKKKELE